MYDSIGKLPDASLQSVTFLAEESGSVLDTCIIISDVDISVAWYDMRIMPSDKHPACGDTMVSDNGISISAPL